jgi:hypothetical protein
MLSCYDETASCYHDNDIMLSLQCYNVIMTKCYPIFCLDFDTLSRWTPCGDAVLLCKVTCTKKHFTSFHFNQLYHVLFMCENPASVPILSESQWWCKSKRWSCFIRFIPAPRGELKIMNHHLLQ